MAHSMITTKRKRFELAFAEMEQDFSTHKSYWRDLLDYVAPMRARFTIDDANNGTRKNIRIINSRTTDNLTILKSGMMATTTNPSLTWARLTVEDKVLAEQGEVKEWTGTVTDLMSAVFLKSNLYKVLPTTYGDMASVANAAMLVEEDLEDVIRCYPIPVGAYMISANSKGKIDGFAREFRMTVRQIVEKFLIPEGQPLVEDNIDWTKASKRIKTFWDMEQRETWVDICHMILPNNEYDPSKLDSKYKRYSAVYFEKGTGTLGRKGRQSIDPESSELFLMDSGLDFFNVLAPRWEVTGEDAYGTNCPAMIAHGDSKSLQKMEKRKSYATELKVNPPTVWPTVLKKKKNSALAGDKIYVDENSENTKVRALYDINFDTRELAEDMRAAESRIDAAFHRDAFAPISGQPVQGTPPSAAEVNARVSESRLKLGTAVQNIQDDLLEPLIDITFHFMQKQNLLPEPPEVLRGVDLKVEFVGVLAQAQKTVALGGLHEFTNFVATLMAGSDDPTVWDKVDKDQLIDEFATGSAIANGIVLTDEQTEELRFERQQAIQAQQAQEAMVNMAGAAKDLSQAELGGDTALDAVAGSLEGEALE